MVSLLLLLREYSRSLGHRVDAQVKASFVAGYR